MRIRATTSGRFSVPCWESHWPRFRTPTACPEFAPEVLESGIRSSPASVPAGLDAAIRNAKQGEIARIRQIARELRAVCFNGNTAGRARSAWAAAGYATLVLPSTSPAYARPVEEKLAAWRAVREFLEER